METYEKVTTGTSAEESAFMDPFKNCSEVIKADALKAVKDSIIPGFKTIMNCLQNNYMPNLRENIAATSLPNGKEYYVQVRILEEFKFCRLLKG